MRKLSALLSLVLLSSLALVVSAQEKKKDVDVSGTWRYEYELEGQSRKDALLLQVGKDGQVTGSYQGVSEKPVEIKSGKVEGDKVTLEVSLNYQGVPVKVNYSGKVKGDEIVGDVVATHTDGELKFDWNAKRTVEASDVVGVWELEIDAGDRVLEPVLEVTLEGKELKATYIDPTTNNKITAEKPVVDKNNLKFTVKSKLDSADLKADFSGRPYGNKISGTVEYDLGGQTGSVEFKGIRKSAEVKKETPKK
jgi:hypothetical protein